MYGSQDSAYADVEIIISMEATALISVYLGDDGSDGDRQPRLLLSICDEDHPPVNRNNHTTELLYSSTRNQQPFQLREFPISLATLLRAWAQRDSHVSAASNESTQEQQDVSSQQPTTPEQQEDSIDHQVPVEAQQRQQQEQPQPQQQLRQRFERSMSPEGQSLLQRSQQSRYLQQLLREDSALQVLWSDDEEVDYVAEEMASQQLATEEVQDTEQETLLSNQEEHFGVQSQTQSQSQTNTEDYEPLLTPREDDFVVHTQSDTEDYEPLQENHTDRY